MIPYPAPFHHGGSFCIGKGSLADYMYVERWDVAGSLNVITSEALGQVEELVTKNRLLLKH